MKESKSTLNWICNALQFITHRTKFYETFLPCLFAEDEDAAMDNVDKDIWESPFGFGLTVLYVHVVFDSVLTFSKHFIYIYGLDNVACFHCIKMFYTLQMGGSQWLPRFFYSLSLSSLFFPLNQWVWLVRFQTRLHPKWVYNDGLWCDLCGCGQNIRGIVSHVSHYNLSEYTVKL